MKPQFSEFSYGFAITREIAEGVKANSLSAPILPSLRQEGKLGWDAEFRLKGASLFLQYKTSDWLSTRRAKFWKKLGGPYFRFPIYRHRDSSQHNLLVALSRKVENVHYCAPVFHESGEFNEFYFQDRILQNSVWVHLGNLPLLEEDDTVYHYVLYTKSISPYFATDPEPIEGVVRASDGLARLLSSLTVDDAPIVDLSHLQTLWRHVSTVAGRFLPRRSLGFLDLGIDLQNPNSIIGALREVLRSFFGLELLVLTAASTTREQP